MQRILISGPLEPQLFPFGGETHAWFHLPALSPQSVVIYIDLFTLGDRRSHGNKRAVSICNKQYIKLRALKTLGLEGRPRHVCSHLMEIRNKPGIS